jgi:hypothetical protein
MANQRSKTAKINVLLTVYITGYFYDLIIVTSYPVGLHRTRVTLSQYLISFPFTDGIC